MVTYSRQATSSARKSSTVASSRSSRSAPLGGAGFAPSPSTALVAYVPPPDPPKKKIWERGKQSMLGTRGNALLPLAPPSVRVIQEGADMLFPIPKF